MKENVATNHRVATEINTYRHHDVGGSAIRVSKASTAKIRVPSNDNDA